MSLATKTLRTRASTVIVGVSVACALAAISFSIGGMLSDQPAYAASEESQASDARSAETSDGYLYAVHDKETNLWGFIDAQGAQVIPCQFESLGSLPGEAPHLETSYSDSKAATAYFPGYVNSFDLPGGVMADDPFPAQDADTKKWGYIDRTGAWVIDPVYEEARVFSDGLGLVYSKEKSAGFVNAQGELVISGFTAATSFTDGVAFVAGKPDDEKNGIKHNDAYAAIDKNGAWALDSAKSSTETDRYCYQRPIFFHDGLGFKGIEDGKAIYIDDKGNQMLSVSSGHEDEGVKISGAGPFYDGYAIVELQGYDAWADMGCIGFDGTTAYGLIDKNGALVKDPSTKTSQFATFVDLWGGLNHVSGGLVAAKDSVTGLWGYLDAKTGEWKIQPRFSGALPFSEGMAYAQDFATGDWGIINDSGTWTAVPRLTNFDTENETQSLLAADGLVYGSGQAPSGVTNATIQGWLNAQGMWIASWE